MSSLRQQLLHIIEDRFMAWLSQTGLKLACQKGCATCCTQNVTITAVEGDRIHQHINDNDLHAWFAECLQGVARSEPASQTTNEFAERCLAGEEAENSQAASRQGSCPFLAQDSCRIYAARPFSCRSFASLASCKKDEEAEVPAYYVSAASAGQQLIEHVGQGQYWGNMYDVLLALCDQPENSRTAELLASPSLIDQARARLRKARPLPGFLISAEEYDLLAEFITSVFAEKIGDKTVEDILNGR